MRARYYPTLAAAIAARGLTHAEVGVAIGITAGSVGSILRGSIRPSSTTRARLVELFGIDEGELFALSPDVTRLIEAAHANGFDHLLISAQRND